MTVIKKALNIPKVWLRVSKTAKDGKIMKFRWEQLPKHRFEEFIDFKMNYYIKHEFSHCTAGIHKNPEAMNEYKQILLEQYKNPSYCNNICCVDDENGKMVAFDSLKMLRKGEILFSDHFERVQTSELRLYYKYICICDDHYPVSDVLTKYNVNAMMDDAGTAVHPDFRGYHFTKEIDYIRYNVTKAHAVSLTGAWMTSIAVQKATAYDGWETVYEFSCDELEKILGIKLEKAPPKIMYRVRKIE